jgi:pimeloyl-ACP methyl ester carboxylesterase
LLVFLHGFPEFWYGWRNQLQYFAERGFRVCAPDQRGYNLSEKPAGVASYRLETLAADVSGLIAGLGRENAVVIGHDWGAAVTWAVSTLYPERVEKVVILNVPHPAAMRDLVRRSLRQGIRSWYVAFFQIPGLPEARMRANDWRALTGAMRGSSSEGTFSEQDLRMYRQAWFQPGAMTAMVNWYRALRQAPPGEKTYSRVNKPVLVIWGARDRFLGRELAQMSIDHCDRGRLVVIEEATHWVHHEEPERVNGLIEEYIRN